MKIVELIFKGMMYLIYKIFPPKIFIYVNKIFNRLYALYKSNEFKSVGNKITLNYPIYMRGAEYVTIGDNFYSDVRLRLEAWDEHLKYQFSPKITIGNNVSINSDCHIGAINEIIIEDGVLIASKVYITDHYHGQITSQAIESKPSDRKLFSKGAVKIEKNVWIGEGVVILPNVTVGENSIIGANAVVTKSIPKNSVVGGNPAKIIRTI